ncbi:MAG: cytochrome c biogenesis protein ResB [Planctomycetota bacterium]|jgi:hypothetical protein
MTATQKWRTTSWGTLVVFIGGLRFAVPLMILITAAMILGTYLDSTQGARVAFRIVYASWWFISLMVLVALSLAFAVVTRYPWKRRHIGFITVHVGLIVLMIGGFWSLFGRVEGQLRLIEGTAGNAIELDAQQLDLVSLEGGTPRVIDATSMHAGTAGVVLGGHAVTIVEHWKNSTEEQYVADDGHEPLRALQFVFGPPPSEPRWIGQASKSGGAAFINGIAIRVLGEGETWSPPAVSGAGVSEYSFRLDGTTHPLAAEGEEVIPGWRVESVRRYASAQVGPEGLSETPDGTPNPAIEVTLADARGTIEKHTAFLSFPDMVLSRLVSGDVGSGAQLVATGGQGKTLIIHDDHEPMRATYVNEHGIGREIVHDGSIPWTIAIEEMQIQIVGEVTRARMATRIVEAPEASEFRPAIVVSIDGSPTTPVRWKSSAAIPGRSALTLRYGPPVVPLPFSLHLQDFRKTDYPGTIMAMAYESDVRVVDSSNAERDLTISMNNPYVDGDWRVYQSGFIEDRISIFSVMKDPGLPMTYLGCVVLCVGIVITFYSHSLSWGHPGVATRRLQHDSQQERNNESHPHNNERDSAGSDDAGGTRDDSGQRDQDGSQVDTHPGGGASDAPGHLRPPDSGPADRAHEVVGRSGTGDVS